MVLKYTLWKYIKKLCPGKSVRTKMSVAKLSVHGVTSGSKT